MQLLYDEEGDVLEVIFKDGAENVAEAGCELRKGMVLYVTADMAPAQLTIVSFRPLTQLPVVHFDRLEKQSAKIRNNLLRLIASPPLSRFLRIDPVTFYGQIMSPALLDVCPA
ncbi:hypothetical protein L0244_31515 [bacterium]|nr:hypothetical protein [bacterium]